ncbi:saccharopine dehydrogenase [Rhodobacter veldkampii DSM 11550]|uniref:Saccharopine dehydrogenase [NAD(+), L-lysine-forming] n=1 Tax=Phaeovulum veldkampii DSM 11550 TaxID=1185920 RepID=A0A2T4JLN6_9RHOB|nr:saccharopine dehydrogenase [Phaeovulum veldkampii]MBK5946523.1 saccharopine dehydrogenase [Phaeovulum veldkampii DSM 11550]PTE18782.1 saccharopine dehydrogenase [Phaeovulum veldkampii DSM 11550]TDQ60002.1 saccharopine dehydrogenase (NAD+, L-lysine-forming) [Phaeovulum veldkampii DSM 11550]
MTHLWVRAEQRPNEERVGLTPEGAAALIAAGLRVTVEESSVREIAIAGYRDAGCTIAPENTWPEAPRDAIIFGLKELPEDGTALPHRHIMFGHAFKGQPAGQVLLRRFRAGGGTLYDLEYLVDEAGRRVAAFGYWAGYAGAAVALKCWAAQARGGLAGPVAKYPGRAALLADLAADLGQGARPRAIVIGALGRVGTGAVDLCAAMGVPVTRWDMAETAHGGPFPEVLAHDIFLNCILARPGCPVFVPASARVAPRALRVIGDIACDPTSDFSPIKVYDRATDWAAPALRVAEAPPLDVTAIDNLPSLLPRESSEDYAAQLLPALLALGDPGAGVWGRAKAEFDRHMAQL